jgi:hypothetical protein
LWLKNTEKSMLNFGIVSCIYAEAPLCHLCGYLIKRLLYLCCFLVCIVVVVFGVYARPEASSRWIAKTVLFVMPRVPEWSGAAALLPEMGLELHVTKRDTHNKIQGYLLFSVPTPLTAAWKKSLIKPAVASVRTAGAAPGPSSDPIFFSVPSATAPAIDFPVAATDSSVVLNHDI